MEYKTELSWSFAAAKLRYPWFSYCFFLEVAGELHFSFQFQQVRLWAYSAAAAATAGLLHTYSTLHRVKQVGILPKVVEPKYM
jgi:hypothetical protein